jgi:hypothetical protein
LLQKTIALCILLLSFNGYGEEPQAPITQEAAKDIALSVAGCKESDHCVANGKFSEGAWVFTVLRLPPPDATGKPSKGQGGFIAVKLDAQGHLVKRIPEK